LEHLNDQMFAHESFILFCVVVEGVGSICNLRDTNVALAAAGRVDRGSA
jgi:hypothetical protein